jgi:hypothetical protein
MEKLEKFGGQTPMGRAGQPAELGSIYVQLAAADASYATGQVYGAAGGSGQPVSRGYWPSPAALPLKKDHNWINPAQVLQINDVIEDA